MKFLLVIFIITLLSVNVDGQNEVSPKLYKSLQGKWAKMSGEKDTLEFGKFNSEKTFILTKQFGRKPPQDPEGPYEFKLTPDGIYLQWLFCSTMIFHKTTYFFKLDSVDKTLIIGNFYATPKDINLLYFKKVTNPSSAK